MSDILRKAEQLWFEWSGEGHEPLAYKSVTYYTIGHMSMDNEVVVGGLASALQRDGLVDTLGAGKKAIEVASFFSHGYVGFVDGQADFTVCSELGETFYGDMVEELQLITFVEVVGLG